MEPVGEKMMRASSLRVKLFRQLGNGSVSWEGEFNSPLQYSVKSCFKTRAVSLPKPNEENPIHLNPVQGNYTKNK